MNDAQKLQLIRMKVEELQDDLAGRKSRRRARAAAAATSPSPPAPPPPAQTQPSFAPPQQSQPEAAPQPAPEDLSGRKGRSFEPDGPGGEPGPGGQPGPAAEPGEEMGDGIEYTGNPYGELDYLPDDDNMVDDDFSNGVVDATGMGDVSVGVGQSSMGPVLGVIGLLSSGLSAYHGYRRNDSIGWGVGWGILGAVFPIITPAIAFAQGFGQPADRPLRANDGEVDELEEIDETDDGDSDEVDVEEFEDEDEPLE